MCVAVLYFVFRKFAIPKMQICEFFCMRCEKVLDNCLSVRYYTDVAEMRQYKRKEVDRLVDTVRLRKRITDQNMTVADVATKMNIDKATLYRRISAPESFTIGEVLKISEILGLPHKESAAIFFAEQVA